MNELGTLKGFIMRRLNLIHDENEKKNTLIYGMSVLQSTNRLPFLDNVMLGIENVPHSSFI